MANENGNRNGNGTRAALATRIQEIITGTQQWRDSQAAWVHNELGYNQGYFFNPEDKLPAAEEGFDAAHYTTAGLRHHAAGLEAQQAAYKEGVRAYTISRLNTGYLTLEAVQRFFGHAGLEPYVPLSHVTINASLEFSVPGPASRDRAAREYRDAVRALLEKFGQDAGKDMHAAVTSTVNRPR